jgi:hypothetical protein
MTLYNLLTAEITFYLSRARANIMAGDSQFRQLVRHLELEEVEVLRTQCCQQYILVIQLTNVFSIDEEVERVGRLIDLFCKNHKEAV